MGKKISVPKDVMMEELNLPSNRGSRMFQERLRRVERFTLENQVHDHYSNVRTHTHACMHGRIHAHTQTFSYIHIITFQTHTPCLSPLEMP